MTGPPAKTTGSSGSGTLPDVLLQLGADVRARLVSTRRSSSVAPDIAELEGRLKARLDAHGQRLAALEQASLAFEGSSHTARRSRSPGPAPLSLADQSGNTTPPPPAVGDGLHAEIKSDITRHLEVLLTEVAQQLVGDFTSRLDALRHEVDRRFSEMTAALDSLGQGRPSGMSQLALPPQANEIEKAAWSEGWRAGQLKALEATSPDFGPRQQATSSRISEASSAHPLMSAIEPSPSKNTGRRSLSDESSRPDPSRDKHWL